MNLQDYKDCVDAIDEQLLRSFKETLLRFNDIIILGNGGSSAISCHAAEDYTTVLGKRALCFGDAARLSCYANDYGWEHAYIKFIEHFALPDTLVVLISSSGNSKNILNAAEYCRYRHSIVTLSGFSENNPLKTIYGEQSLFHFWVNSSDYGTVECIHELILHSVL